MPFMYVPVVKSKSAEWVALQELPDGIGPVVPLVEMTPPPPRTSTLTPVDWTEEVLHEADFVWQCDELFLDARPSGFSATALRGRHVYDHLADLRWEFQVRPIPVVRVDDPEAVLLAAGRLQARVTGGLAIRVTGGNHPNLTPSPRSIDRCLARTRTEPSRVDLLLDLASLPTTFDLTGVAGLVTHAVAALPYRAYWRQIVLLGTTAPATNQRQPYAPPLPPPLPRREWQLWRTVLASPGLPRPIAFGDYAGFHPTLPTARFSPTNPSLRYTTDSGQLIIKVRPASDRKLHTFANICRWLIGSPHYSGPDFSWGDKRVFTIAHGTERPAGGGAQGWRQIAVNHHITQVMHQLRTPPTRELRTPTAPTADLDNSARDAPARHDSARHDSAQCGESAPQAPVRASQPPDW